jgi:hypothetical protein
MSYKNIDQAVMAALQHLSSLAADEEARLHLQRVLSQRGVKLLACDGDEYLFKMQEVVREGFEEYHFFFMGRLLEVRRIGWLSSEYSLLKYPSELASHRQRMQQQFSTMIVSTADGLGWFEPGPWEELSDEQKALCRPKFVADDIRHFSI